MEGGKEMLYCTLMKCLSGLAEEGDHAGIDQSEISMPILTNHIAGVMALLERVNHDSLLSKGILTNRLLSVYSSRGEADNLHEVCINQSEPVS